MYDRRTRAYLSRSVADALLAGVWNEARLAARAGQVLEPRPRWIRPVVREVLAAYHRPPADRPRELAAFIALWLEAQPAIPAHETPRVRRRLLPELAMGRRPWPVPEMASVGALAKHLGVSDGHLAWLADARGLERTVSEAKLRHYAYGWLPRRSGLPRVIERPKARLKEIQRRVLHEVLDWIPAHDAAHGFTRGRSARSHATLHVGRPVVMAFDLEDFFASVTAGRIFGIFRTAGYPEPVAHALTALTTNAVPVKEWAAVPTPAASGLTQGHHRLCRRLATPHLPQGAPTSPALANLAAFTLDRRLAGLAAALDATYSRYADDLTISGSRSLLGRSDSIQESISVIVRDEGFRVNCRKSVLTTRAGRQLVCGVVVNDRLNVSRGDYDELKAILHNAARRGPAGENHARVPDFRAHLLGRITWVESLNPERGAKLRSQFARIVWPD